ncbi:hypothetical protein SBY92_003468 [Candida maltosa Xu316]
MLQRRTFHLLPQVRKYSRTVDFSFLTNDAKHIFEQEKLTPEQNKAAIPPKPTYDHLKKIHHEVLHPEDACDLVVKINSTDILSSILSENKALFGDENYIIGGNNEPTNFVTASILCSWSNIFNKRIKSLEEIEPLEFWEPSMSPKVKDLYQTYGNEFDEFFKHTRALENSKEIKEGTLQPSEVSNYETIDNVSLYVLGKLDTYESVAQFSEFMNKNIAYYSVEGLVDNLSKLTDICFRQHGYINYDFIVSIKDRYPGIFKKLSPDTLDKLGYLLASRDLKLSRKMLKVLIEKSVCPSEATTNEFLLQYVDVDPETKLKELTFIKPVFFHRGVNELTLQVLLSTIRNVQEYGKLIDLVKISENKTYLLEKYQNILMMVLKKVSSNFPLHLAQFVRVLTEENVPVDQDVIRKLQSGRPKRTV